MLPLGDGHVGECVRAGFTQFFPSMEESADTLGGDEEGVSSILAGAYGYPLPLRAPIWQPPVFVTNNYLMDPNAFRHERGIKGGLGLPHFE